MRTEMERSVVDKWWNEGVVIEYELLGVRVDLWVSSHPIPEPA